MADPTTAIIAEVRHRVVGAGGYTAIDGQLVSQMSSSRANDTIPTGRGIDKIVGSRMTETLGISDWSLFSGFDANQRNDDELDIEIEYSNGAVIRLNPVSIVALPDIYRIPSAQRLYVAPVGTNIGTNPAPNSPWVDIGEAREGLSVQFSANSDNKADGRRRYTAMSMEVIANLFGNATTPPRTTLAGYEGGQGMLAIGSPDGLYAYFLDATFATRIDPGEIGLSNSVTWQLTLQDADANISNIWTPPAFADYINGFTLELDGFGYSESDFVTFTPAS